MTGRIRVEPSRWGWRKRTTRYWKIVDNLGPKVFTRIYVYSSFDAAVTNAHRIAVGDRITPWGLMSVQTMPRTAKR